MINWKSLAEIVAKNININPVADGRTLAATVQKEDPALFKELRNSTQDGYIGNMYPTLVQIAEKYRLLATEKSLKTTSDMRACLNGETLKQFVSAF